MLHEDKKRRATLKLYNLKSTSTSMDLGNFNRQFAPFFNDKKTLKAVMKEWERQGKLIYRKQKRLIIFTN